MYGYLMHHGVKGMRWGVRNYQNADGTLTAEGRRHYHLENTSLYKGTTRQAARAMNRHVRALRKQRDADYMADLKTAREHTKGIKNIKNRIAANREIREHYDRGNESINKALKLKYGKEAYDLHGRQEVAKAVAALAGMAIVAGGVSALGEYVANRH